MAKTLTADEVCNKLEAEVGGRSLLFSAGEGQWMVSVESFRDAVKKAFNMGWDACVDEQGEETYRRGYEEGLEVGRSGY